MTLAAALFAALIDGHFPARATRIAAVWFALGAGVSLLSSRVPFDLGWPSVSARCSPASAAGGFSP